MNYTNHNIVGTITEKVISSLSKDLAEHHKNCGVLIFQTHNKQHWFDVIVNNVKYSFAKNIYNKSILLKFGIKI